MRRGCGLCIVIIVQSLDNLLHLRGNSCVLCFGVGRDGMLIVGGHRRGRSFHQNIVAFLGRQLDRSKGRHKRRVAACGKDGLGF